MSQMLKSSGAIALATLISRVLGLVREVAYAQFMGNGLVASAFAYAFTIPNLFRRLLGEGALTAAFIPYFKEKQKLEGEKAMWHCANAVISGLILATGIVVAVVVVICSLLVWSGKLPVKMGLMLDLLRWMAPYLPMVCFAAVCMAMLNARGHFFLPALGPAMLNVVMIASVFWFAPHLGSTLEKQVFGLALGVLIAGVVQAAFQMPGLHRDGFRYRWVNPFTDPSIRHIARQMIPGTIGIAAFQINVVLTMGFGYWVGDHVVSSFSFAVRLMELPQGLFGVSMATYLLPTLSGMVTEKKFDDFRATLAQGIGYVLFTNIIAGCLLVGLAQPIIRLLFEWKRFDALATERVASALILLAPGLLAFSSVNILARAFYALKDTATPTRISIFCLLINLGLTALFIRNMEQAGMALANSLTSFLNVALLLFALRKKIARLEFGRLWSSLPLNLAVGVAAGACAWFLAGIWTQQLGSQGLWTRLGGVFVPALLASMAYVVIIYAARIGYGHQFLGELFKKVGSKVAHAKPVELATGSSQHGPGSDKKPHHDHGHKHSSSEPKSE